MRLLDTDVLIDILRNHLPAVQWLSSLPELPVIPGLAYLELIQGCTNKNDVHVVEALVEPMKTIWPTDADFQRARSQFADLHLRAGVGLLDVLIGACAVGRDAILCTHNLKHYGQIPNLLTEQPYPK